MNSFVLILFLMMTWQLPQDMEKADWEPPAAIRPKGYVSYFAAEPPRIDGRVDDPAWQDAPWTDLFEDIEGDRKPKPRFDTRAAIRWDGDFLYVAAHMEEPHVWGSLTEKNSVIFQDKDFEIFIDPDGDHHYYYEFEVNALNTIWELTLEKPYRDGGPVVSPTNIGGLMSAVHVEGTLNAPHDVDRFWSVEVAIPWEGLAPYSRRGAPPAEGEQWRMNFSRVHWQHELDGNAYQKVPDKPENNWVWSPQGVVDMHRPERWGYVQFSPGEPGTTTFRPDPTMAARDRLMAVYYDQKAFQKQHGRWAKTPGEIVVPDNVEMIVEHDAWKARTRTATDEMLEVNHESRLTTLP